MSQNKKKYRANEKNKRQIGEAVWDDICTLVNSGKDADVVVKEADDTRTTLQNDRMWAQLSDISRQVEWYGQKLSPEDWKHIFSASVEKQRAVPGLDGGFVVLGISTRKKSKRWFNDMFLVIEAFAAEKGVKFKAPEWRDCA